MLYWIFYYLMIIGYAGVSLSIPDLKMKIIGVLLVIVNGLLFWK